MYRLARESQVRGSARGQDDDDLKVPALPDHTPHARSQEIPQVEEEDRKMPAASVPATAPSHQTSEHLYPQIEEEDRKMPAASTPGAVAALPTARDPAAIKQAAARDPARLSHASPNTAHNRSEARRSTQARQTETDEGIKQRYRTAGATALETPGATKVAGIEDSGESFDDISYGTKDKASESVASIDACPLGQEPTITAQLAPTDDEVMKRFVEDIPVAEAEVAPNRKRWFIIGGVGVLACAGLGAGLGVALSGDDSSPQAAPPPPIRADTCLEETDNPGVFFCYKEDFPAIATTTIFFNCPSNDEEQFFNCERCVVAAISDINELFVEDDVPLPPLCSGCIICEDSVSFDCANLFPEDECALQTCSGNCGKDPVPSPSPDTQATGECLTDVELDTYFCNKEDIPFDFLVTQFQDCPPGAENNVYECQSCFVVLEDTVADIDAATSQVCNGCINCGDSVAYDCSNLFPGEECSAVDCDGKCFGDRQA